MWQGTEVGVKRVSESRIPLRYYEQINQRQEVYLLYSIEARCNVYVNLSIGNSEEIPLEQFTENIGTQSVSSRPVAYQLRETHGRTVQRNITSYVYSILSDNSEQTQNMQFVSFRFSLNIDEMRQRARRIEDGTGTDGCHPDDSRNRQLNMTYAILITRPVTMISR
jgi:hypothetical protein